MFLYAGGKMDWLAFALPREGKLAETPNAGEIARRDIPTCRIDEKLGEVQARVRAAGWDACVAVNDRQIVLGLLRAKALSGDPTATVVDVMAEGPSTFRPGITIEELTHYLRDRDLETALISTSDGVLIGMFLRSDGERALRGLRATGSGQRRTGNRARRATFGFKLCSEEVSASDLLRYARRAEQAGLVFAAISDHFHPWISRQGQSPFVWSVIGGVAASTDRLRVGTSVTCPTMRMHPAIVAHAAATAATLLPGRFYLGLGSGEYLNEHILGDCWPTPPERLEMLEEAITVIRLLWKGGQRSHRGRYYTVDQARIFSLPDQPPPIYVAAGGPKAARLAARLGDGLIGVAADREIVGAFEETGGTDKPRYAEIGVCWARDEAEAVRTAREYWPIAGLGPKLLTDLPTPTHFEQAAQPLREEDIAPNVVCGSHPDAYLTRIQEYLDAGFDHLFLHQIGPDQEGFFGFYEHVLGPELVRLGMAIQAEGSPRAS
ncbi:MAG TPA: TIGR03557 family F420-dependent LLM class oxidoreductase [Dehalococcoidia bacterium]|nr:TIGR03557 family F420-dependent LLM class oxidoreductase [Dehalococcoidia bacterium]